MVNNHIIYFEYTLRNDRLIYFIKSSKCRNNWKSILDTSCFRYISVHQISNENIENISAIKENLVRRNVRVRGKKVSIRYLAIIQRSIFNDAEIAKKIPFRRQSIFPFGKSNIAPLHDPIQYQGFDDYYCQKVFMQLIFDVSAIEWNTLFLILDFVHLPSQYAR